MALPPSFSSSALPRPAAAAQPVPGANGGYLARGLSEVAGSVQNYVQDRAETAERVADLDHRAATIEKDRRIRSRYADRAAALAEMEAELGGALVDLRASAGPGAAGHEEKVAEEVDRRVADFMGTLDEPELIDMFRADVASLAGRTKLNEKKFAIEAGAVKAVTDFTSLRETLSNKVFTDPSGANLTDGLKRVGDAVAMMDLPDDKKAELLKESQAALTIRAWQGALNVDAAGALAALDKGALNHVAEGQQLVSLRQTAVARVEHLAALERAKQNAALEAFREEARLDVEKANEGVAVDPGALSDKAAQAEAAGEKDLAHDLRVAAAKAGVTAKYAGASVAELEAAKREIEQTGDWRKNEQLVAAHAQLGTLSERTRTRAASDKLALWSENGGRLSPIDITNGAGVGARIAEARAAQKRYGGPLVLLTEAEAAPARESFAKGGPTDKAAVIELFSGHGNDVAKAFMRQMAPARPELAALVDLATLRNAPAGRALMREALNGWEEAKANKTLLGGETETLMQREIGRRYRDALAMMDPVAKQGVLTVAKGIYATRAARAGGGRFDRELWLQAYGAALGAAGDGTGGIGRTRGGAAMVLPRGMTQGDFDVVLARSDAKSIMQAGGDDFPTWGGKPMRASEFKKMVPVMVSDGRYMFRSGSGFLRSGKRPDQNFVLDIRALGRLTRGRPAQ